MAPSLKRSSASNMSNLSSDLRTTDKVGPDAKSGPSRSLIGTTAPLDTGPLLQSSPEVPVALDEAVLIHLKIGPEVACTVAQVVLVDTDVLL
jgi:hypothetical protein